MTAGIDPTTTPAQSVRWFVAVVASFAFAVGIASGSSWSTGH